MFLQEKVEQSLEIGHYLLLQLQNTSHRGACLEWSHDSRGREMDSYLFFELIESLITPVKNEGQLRYLWEYHFTLLKLNMDHFFDYFYLNQVNSILLKILTHKLCTQIS